MPYVVKTTHLTASGDTEHGPELTFDNVLSAEDYALRWCRGGGRDERAEVFQIINIEGGRRLLMSFARQPDGSVMVRDRRL